MSVMEMKKMTINLRVLYIYMGNTIIIRGDRIRSGQSTIACEGMNKS